MFGEGSFVRVLSAALYSSKLMEDRCTEHPQNACPHANSSRDAKSILPAHSSVLQKLTLYVEPSEADQRYWGKCSVMLWSFRCVSQFQIFCPIVPMSYQNIRVISLFLFSDCIFHMASSTQKQHKNLTDHVPEFGVWKMFTLRKEIDQQLLFRSIERTLPACRLHVMPCPGLIDTVLDSWNPSTRRASCTLSPEARPHACPWTAVGAEDHPLLLDLLLATPAQSPGKAFPFLSLSYGELPTQPLLPHFNTHCTGPIPTPETLIHLPGGI